ncbi:MAG: histidine triad nucleotide-binding protein [Rickettsiales bacterium]|jgi:diadenosine tetraphosphate (Ap4A) HIT family hydrolase|nr:histidine triad nucleotide-binding protein [Rickettsiales bacterium]
MQYQDNIFSKIIRKEIPSDIVYEDDKVLAFNDISPSAPTHILLVPKGEFVSFDDFASKSTSEDISYFFKKARQIAEDKKLKDYRIVANCGEKAGQVVFHFHLHIIGGWEV